MVKGKTKKTKGKKKKLHGYCFTCQEARTVKDGEVVLLRSGKKLLQGSCSNCGKSVSGMMTSDTPHDRVQTKKEAKENRVRHDEERGRRIIRLRSRYDKNRN